METKLDILIRTISDNSGLDKLTGANTSASSSTKTLDKAQKSQAGAAKQASSANGGLASGLQGLAGKLAAAAAAYMSYNVLVKDAVKLAGVQRKADSNLMSSLANSAKARGLDASAAAKQYSQIKTLAAAKQEELGIGDEVLQQSARWFVSAGANIDQMGRLMDITADMAEVTGQDAVQSAKDLTKIYTNLGGAVGQLRERGVAFSQSEAELITHLEKTNQKAQAQEIILKKLEDTYGGTAKNALNEFGGEFKRLGNTFGDVQESLGVLWEAMAAPAAKDLKNTMQGLISVFSSPDAKNFVSTLSGIAGAIGEFGKLTIGPVLEQLGGHFKKVAEDADKFFSSIANIGAGGAVVIGALVSGFKLVGDAIVDITTVAYNLGKVLLAALMFDKKALGESLNNTFDSVKGGLQRLVDNTLGLFDSKKMEEKGKAIAKSIQDGYVKSFKATKDRLEKGVTVPPPTSNPADVAQSAKNTASLWSEALARYIKDNSAGIQAVISGALDIADSFSGLFTLGLKKEVDDTERALADLEAQYASLYDEMSARQEELAEQDRAEEERKQEQAYANMEAELERLSLRTDAYMSAEEKKKFRELARNRAAMKAEKERAAEETRLAQQKADLDKKLAEERANIEFAQKTAEWENQKLSFEANKKQQLYTSSMAMVRAPIDGTLAILRAGAESGLVGVLAMTAAVAGMIGSVVGGAVQLASTANQSFDVPAPVKAYYSGGVVPLEEGRQFLMGGAMGMEELATVRGGNLYIDDAQSTKNKVDNAGVGMSIIIQHMTVQANNPVDFAQQLKTLVRRERYL